MSPPSRLPPLAATLIAALVVMPATRAVAVPIEWRPPPIKALGPITRPPAFHALADIAEAEPNDSPGQAQAVGCGNSLRPASLTNVMAVPDTDWISFTATSGDFVTFETAADAPDTTDTVIDLIADDGTTVLATNDDSGPTTVFSRIANFAAPYTGLFYGRIRGFAGSQGPYRANLICGTPPPVPPNDQCAGAIVIPEGNIDLSGDLSSANDDYDLCPGVPVCATSCTDFYSPGKDIVFRLEAIEAGDLLDVTYSLGPVDADASLYLVTDCADIQGTCVAGQDAAQGMPPERLVYTFTAPGIYYLILDGFSEVGNAWTLTGCMRCSTPVQTQTWGSIKTLYR